MATRTLLAREETPAALQLGSGAYRESYSRYSAVSNMGVMTSGVMLATALPLYAGDVVTNLSFWAGTTALTMGSNVDGHLFFALYDPSITLLSQTADQGGAATWTANTIKTLALGAAQTIAATGLHYAGVMVNSGTGGSPAVPSLRGVSIGVTPFAGGTASGWPTGVKQLGGSNGTGLTTTAPAGPLTLTTSANCPYCLAT